MPPPGRQADWSALQKLYTKRTKILVLARSAPCGPAVNEWIAEVGNRSAVLYTTGAHPTSPGSWFMALLVCPDDDFTDIAEGLASIDPPESHRIRIFYRPEDQEMAYAVQDMLATRGVISNATVLSAEVELRHGLRVAFNKAALLAHGDVVYEDAHAHPEWFEDDGWDGIERNVAATLGKT